MTKKAIRRSARMRDDYQVFVEVLAEVREQAKVTQTELADRLGKPQSWVAKAENGGRRVDALELISILDALGVDVASFVTRLRKALKKASH